MGCEEDCRTAVFGKTERTVGWEGTGDPTMMGLVRHCIWGNPQQQIGPPLPSMSHSFTLESNIYVRRLRAGERVMESLTRFITTRFKRVVNEAKSAVARPWERQLLGFSSRRHRAPKRRIAPQAVKRFKKRLRTRTQRTRGRRLETLVKQVNSDRRGWQSYLGFCQTPSVFGEFDAWLRHRRRSYGWKPWGRTGYRELRRRGVS